MASGLVPNTISTFCAIFSLLQTYIFFFFYHRITLIIRIILKALALKFAEIRVQLEGSGDIYNSFVPFSTSNCESLSSISSVVGKNDCNSLGSLSIR